MGGIREERDEGMGEKRVRQVGVGKAREGERKRRSRVRQEENKI